MKQMYVYIITNVNHTTLYVGVTNDLVRRIYEHKEGLLSGFSSEYSLNKLVYFECIDGEEQAISREKYLKKCYRKTKEKIISKFNPQWQDLYDSIIK